MIWSAHPWLAELKENAQSIDAAIAVLRDDKDAADFKLFFRIEKALLLSAFTIRKLHENGALSSHADNPLVSVTFHPVRGDKNLLRQLIIRHGSIMPHLVCDMSASSHKKIEVRQACNYIIHSNMVAYTNENKNDVYSFWILQGQRMNNFVEIEFDTWISLIRYVPDLLKHTE